MPKRFPTQYFEQHLATLNKNGASEWVGPLADVLDTAYAITCWAEDRDIQLTTDLAALTRLVIERHDQLQSDSQAA